MYSGTPLLLTKRGTIKRATTSSNTWGELKEGSFATHASNVPCRLVSKDSRELVDGNLITLTVTRLYLRFGQDIQVTDRITIDGDTYEITGIDTNPGHSDHHIECAVRRSN